MDQDWDDFVENRGQHDLLDVVVDRVDVRVERFEPVAVRRVLLGQVLPPTCFLRPAILIAQVFAPGLPVADRPPAKVAFQGFGSN